ncbi:hypothetical protein PK35_15495 [Tamlana nanhaiensis]|uniref:Uncharacterized protein n=1 Tax=Neotamlana nanhaiensis TaxID=1382798 RepID=A0A0D7VWS8_9FLAO|nr:hypothetical protein [Tamlana nanhaiensis]KJD31239.1 hypothetical protein PK35_15495 [Tamlana nanhaiensis]
MVKVIDFKKRESKTGEEFFVLVLQGGITPVKSKESGKMYFTAKTATAPTTFDEETCQQIIGQEFPGKIVKVDVEPYEYALPETGEIITLEHRWEYQDESMPIVQDNVVEEEEVM